MPRISLVALSVSSLALIAAFAVGCGSSSPNTTQTCTGTYNVVGDWQITVAGAAKVTGYGAIDSAGQALFFDADAATNSSGDTIQMPTLTGACTYAGNIIAYAEPGGINSGSIITDSISGNVASASSITGSFTGVSSGAVTLVPLTPLAGSVAAITGTKTGQVEGTLNGQPLLIPLALAQSGSNASMTFSGTDGSNCSVSGTFTQQSTVNVFDVSITFTGSGCPITGTMTGLGFESSTDYFFGNTGGTYLYADILDSANTFVMEIY